MSILGDKITLQGWGKFKGGLDIKGIVRRNENPKVRKCEFFETYKKKST
jgi:hypothetical protein